VGDLQVRPMTAAEFGEFRSRLIRGDAAGQVDGLLPAAEREAAGRGARAMGLNVFGRNAVARGRYESGGYEITTLQMRKELTVGGGTSQA